MIKSFKDKAIEQFHLDGTLPKKCQWQSVKNVAARKLDQLDSATRLNDLKLPGNSLERLDEDREGQWSIRINKQWRVCFKWDGPDPEDVEICDYH